MSSTAESGARVRANGFLHRSRVAVDAPGRVAAPTRDDGAFAPTWAEFDLTTMPRMTREQTRELGLELEHSLRRRIVAVLQAQIDQGTGASTTRTRPRERRARRGQASRRGPPGDPDLDQLGRRRAIAAAAGFVLLADEVHAEFAQIPERLA